MFCALFIEKGGGGVNQKLIYKYMNNVRDKNPNIVSVFIFNMPEYYICVYTYCKTIYSRIFDIIGFI